MRVRYIGDVDTVAFEKSKTYPVMGTERNLYRVMTETDDYLFSPRMFEVTEHRSEFMTAGKGNTVIGAENYGVIIGSWDYVCAVFDIIKESVDNSKYPLILNDLYRGMVKTENLRDAAEEMKQISAELSQMPLTLFDRYKALCPALPDKRSEVRSLNDFLLTAEGFNLINLIIDSLKSAEFMKCSLLLKRII